MRLWALSVTLVWFLFVVSMALATFHSLLGRAS